MSVRHQARGVVLQSLFTLDTESKWEGAYADELLTDNTAASGIGQNGFSFAKKLIDTILAKRENLDEVIVQAAPEWPLDRIAIIDRNILRIGLAELLFSDPDDVPPKVALNEAIELAKEYGSDSSSRFVNGVLGAVYRELGEPMKDAPKRTTPAEEPQTDANIEELAGAVVYATDNDIYYLALVHDVFGHWTLSKGKLNEDETPEDAVVRKVQEEIGLAVAVEDSLGENTYTVNDPEEGKKTRRAQFFLAQAPFLDLRFKKEGGLDDAQWFRLTDIGNLNFYDDMLPVITRAVNVLAARRS